MRRFDGSSFLVFSFFCFLSFSFGLRWRLKLSERRGFQIRFNRHSRVVFVALFLFFGGGVVMSSTVPRLMLGWKTKKSSERENNREQVFEANSIRPFCLSLCCVCVCVCATLRVCLMGEWKGRDKMMWCVSEREREKFLFEHSWVLIQSNLKLGASDFKALTPPMAGPSISLSPFAIFLTWLASSNWRWRLRGYVLCVGQRFNGMPSSIFRSLLSGWVSNQTV